MLVPAAQLLSWSRSPRLPPNLGLAAPTNASPPSSAHLPPSSKLVSTVLLSESRHHHDQSPHRWPKAGLTAISDSRDGVAVRGTCDSGLNLWFRSAPQAAGKKLQHSSGTTESGVGVSEFEYVSRMIGLINNRG